MENKNIEFIALYKNNDEIELFFNEKRTQESFIESILNEKIKNKEILDYNIMSFYDIIDYK
jgi:hypothetical protein